MCRYECWCRLRWTRTLVNFRALQAAPPQYLMGWTDDFELTSSLNEYVRALWLPTCDHAEQILHQCRLIGLNQNIIISLLTWYIVAALICCVGIGYDCRLAS